MRLADQPVFARPISEAELAEGLAIVHPQAGMTLRQHYIGLAMAAMVSSIHSGDCYNRLRGLAEADHMKVSEWIASESMKQADAQIKAMERETKMANPHEDTMALLRKIAATDGVPADLQQECTRYAEEWEIPF